MTKIKFRAWDEKEKKMYEVDSIYFPLGITSGKDLTVFRRGSYDWLSIDDVTLMQSTGLRDKNGTEIYEGDIVEGENYLFPCFDNRRVEITWQKESGGFEMNSFNLKDIEVIGNIHENSELLEER